MKFLWVLAFLIGWNFVSVAQLTPEYFSADTIKYNYRMGGITDSMDYSLARLFGNTPGGGADFPSLVPEFSFYSKLRNGYRHASAPDVLRPSFSALPHIGMAYTFGASGTSVARVNYQQIFAKQILVNLKFRNDRGNTQLRNGTFSRNEIDLLVMRKGRIWSTDLSFADHINLSGLNNGIDTSADLSLYALKFQPVERENAESKFRTTDLQWKNFFNVVHFDSSTSLGFLTESRMKITGRRFSEQDSLPKYYSTIYFDTVNTYDKYQWSQVMQQAGIYFHSKSFYAAFKGEGVYWKYYNQGVRDTVELNLLATMKGFISGWNFSLIGKYNLIGAGQGWQTKAALDKKWNKFKWTLSANAENVWADPFLRFYSANNFLYDFSNSLEKQFYALVSNSFNYNIKENFSVNVSIQNSFFENNLMFDGVSWSTMAALSSFTANEFKFRASWSPKFLIIQPEYAFTKTNDFNYVPQHSGKLRLMVKGRLFKAKKLVAWVGVDAHVYSQTNLLEFVPALDTYVANSMTASTQNGMINLHVFGGVQIDEFRFFVRYENLSAMWNQPERLIVKNYPIPSGALLVGLTWDFFN